MDNIDTSYHALPVVTISNVTAKETKIFEDRKKDQKGFYKCCVYPFLKHSSVIYIRQRNAESHQKMAMQCLTLLLSLSCNKSFLVIHFCSKDLELSIMFGVQNPFRFLYFFQWLNLSSKLHLLFYSIGKDFSYFVTLLWHHIKKR